MNNLASLLRKETCSKVEEDKPKDVFQIIFEIANSLGVFATGEARERKLRQRRYLLKKSGLCTWHPLLKPRLTEGMLT